MMMSRPRKVTGRKGRGKSPMHRTNNRSSAPVRVTNQMSVMGRKGRRGKSR